MELRVRREDADGGRQNGPASTRAGRPSNLGWREPTAGQHDGVAVSKLIYHSWKLIRNCSGMVSVSGQHSAHRTIRRKAAWSGQTLAEIRQDISEAYDKITSRDQMARSVTEAGNSGIWFFDLAYHCAHCPQRHTVLQKSKEKVC